MVPGAGMPTIVIIPEYKAALAAPPERGLSLFTVHVRRGAPDVQDPSLNSHSKLNCITACIQARAAPWPCTMCEEARRAC